MPPTPKIDFFKPLWTDTAPRKVDFRSAVFGAFVCTTGFTAMQFLDGRWGYLLLSLCCAIAARAVYLSLPRKSE